MEPDTRFQGHLQSGAGAPLGHRLERPPFPAGPKPLWRSQRRPWGPVAGTRWREECVCLLWGCIFRMFEIFQFPRAAAAARAQRVPGNTLGAPKPSGFLFSLCFGEFISPDVHRVPIVCQVLGI